MSVASRQREQGRAALFGRAKAPEKARGRRLVHVWPSAEPGKVLRTASGFYKVGEDGSWRKFTPPPSPAAAAPEPEKVPWCWCLTPEADSPWSARVDTREEAIACGQADAEAAAKEDPEVKGFWISPHRRVTAKDVADLKGYEEGCEGIQEGDWIVDDDNAEFIELEVK